MFEKFIKAIEPFALTVIILAGANLAGWLKFSNSYIVGVATVLCGTILVVNHVVYQLSSPKQVNKKGN